MDSQTSQSVGFYVILERLETHRKKVALAGALVVLLVAGYALWNWRADENERAANRDLLRLEVGGPASFAQRNAGDYLKVAREYGSTSAGARARLLGAAVQFTQGRFAEAQATFEEVWNADNEGPFAPQALLGVAASLEGQGKKAEATRKYQEISTTYSQESAGMQAKLNLARLYEEDNKPEDALKIYEGMTRTSPADAWASEAFQRKEQLFARYTNLVRSVPPIVATNTSPLLRLP